MLIDALLQQYDRKDSTDAVLTSYTIDAQGNKTYGKNTATVSNYQPSDEVKEITATIVDAFRWADVIMRKPRREFNDYSVLTRTMYDQMAYNTYQPNNGTPPEGDPSQAWKSNAVRPIIRNKVISIAAHATARMLFPKIFAYNQASESQQKSATIMRDLIEWVSDQNDYKRMTVYAVINALVNPVSIMHVEYAEAYRTIKTEKGEDGKWKTREILDEDYSGFKMTPIPVDEFYVADFYTEDVQKQYYLIWRRVQTYEVMKRKYGKLKNFQYVKPGIQVLYNNANVGFYELYDSNLQGSMCEELIFYCKALDLQLTLVNGVMLSDPDQPNPRLDKQYPFIAFGYLNFDEGRAFYKKSLAFGTQPDADIVNTLYPMIIDGTYLNIFSPMIITGEEAIGSDVMIPGAATTLTSPEAAITPLRVAQDIRQGMETLFKVEESINQSTQAPLQAGQAQPGQQTAYEISKQEQNAQTVMGPFITMIGSYVKQYGKLVISDILQYMTLPEVDKLVDNGELVYKTIVIHDRQSAGKRADKNIKFDLTVPEEMTEEDELKASYELLEEQGGDNSKQEIARVNPKLFRDLKYKCVITPDVITPLSDDLERAFGLEVFDKSISAQQAGVAVDMDQAFKDFVLANYPRSKQDADKYIKKQELMPQEMAQPMEGQPPGGGQAVPMPQMAKVNQLIK